MYPRLFRYVKNKLPRISDTEMIALKSGTVSIDRDILSGNIKYPKQAVYYNKFPRDSITNLLENYDNTKIYPNNNNNYWINHLAKNKFFSFLIDKKYGGIKLTVNEQSNILTEIASVSPALGVVAMVPNSLGPGELITLYGTEKQKNDYLPKLANGDLIPCFGLTGPNNGSDATGSIDTGVVFKENNEIKVKVNLNKRYITLAPVANLMGIAFDLKDPDNLLDKTGVTVALVEREHLNLIQETHHNPLDVGFPNGTIKGEIVISLDQIIGGKENVGNGWKMLMECLSAGRGVSLPATANASSKVATFGMYHYIKTREQFKLSLSEMEGVQEKFLNMMYHTWIIQSSVKMTNDILDEGHSPSVISAIMKQQTTERGRIVLNEAMDIHAGSAICLGESNFLEKYYKSIPIGVTVEGSNTLTRSLIIFAQGLNKSHPYIFPILESILNDDVKSFKTNFNNMVKHSLTLYFSCIDKNKNLEQEVVRYAALTNFVALKAGALKKEQMLSGDMADMFSNLYLAISVRYYQNLYKSSPLLSNYIVERLLNENRVIMERVVNNLGPERYLLKPILVKPNTMTYKKNRKVFNEIMNNKKIITEVEKNIYIKNDSILNDLRQYTELQEQDIKIFDKDLYNKIINVGEFENNIKILQ